MLTHSDRQSQAERMPANVAQVVLDTPLPQLDQVYDYEIPAELLGDVVVGSRVRVPLQRGGRVSQGWVVAISDTSSFTGKLSSVTAVLTRAPVLARHIYDLARAVADRSAGVVSDVLRLAVPKRHATAEKQFLALDSPMTAHLPTPGPSAPIYDPDEWLRLRESDSRCFLAADPGVVTTSAGPVPVWALTLARLAYETISSGRSAVIVTPDFRDQACVERALTSLDDSDYWVRIDARLSAQQRFANHLRLLQGRPHVVVGNRSAVYAPVSPDSLIIIWNDGDPSLVEPLSPGAHARDVAFLRSTMWGAPVVVSSHVPTTETQRLLDIGWMNSATPRRPVKPKVELHASPSAPGLSSTAFQRAKLALETGPVLLQVAQPGFSTGAMCQHCRQRASCAHCGGSLYFPSKDAPPACRACGAAAYGWKCPNCSQEKLVPVGAAASRTAEQLGRAFPGVNVIVSDGEHTVLDVPGSPALVIATRGAEPIAAGGYRAVVLLDGNRLLAREGLRVTEDALRLWSNAAALTAADGVVLVHEIEGRVATALVNWSFTEVVRAELSERKVLSLPPVARIASLTASAAVMREVVVTVTAELLEPGIVRTLGPLAIDTQNERLVLQFDYARTDVVSATIKALSIRLAAAPRRGLEREPAQRPRAQLRVRFDDPEVF